MSATLGASKSRMEVGGERGITRLHSCRPSPHAYAQLLALDSVFYQPTHWQSWYAKKLALDLSISDSILRQKRRVLLLTPSNWHSRCVINNHLPGNMIKAMHQFATIRTTYSDQKRSFISDINPLRAMLVQVDFEVYGEVSGVYFTKYAKNMCDNLNLRGWIRISPRGSAYGQIQGEKEKVDEMALWLRLQGSPASKIDYCQFKNWQIIDSCDFRNFTVRY